MTLTQADMVTETAEQQATDIRDLVRRIEEYRQRQTDQVQGAGVVPASHAVARFRFVTDAAGRIIDAEIRGRGRFVGADLSQPAAALEGGCDAGTARKVSKRQPIQSGRLLVTGDDIWAGTWLCDAEPRFASIDGAFMGYTGTLRRPREDEVALPLAAEPAVTGTAGFAPELLRQLMHELRSPLNAIAGFGQLIEGQYAGPVNAVYRSAAATIISETERLSGVVDEIDLLAQLSGQPDFADQDGAGADLGEALAAVQAQLEGSRTGAISLTVEPITDRLSVQAAPSALERLLRLWLEPLGRAGGGSASAPLHLAVRTQAEQITLILDRNPDLTTADATAATPGFAFATAELLAREAGGSLVVNDGQHILNLPLVTQTGAPEEQVG
jgi:hypothetical protein